MQIVSDTSPLIILKKSGAIQILEKLFDEVIVTSKVREELYRKVRPVIEKFLEDGYYLDTRLIEKYLEDLGEI